MTDKKPLPEPLRLSHLYLLSAHDEAELKKRREDARSFLLPYLQENFVPDENGCYIYEFPDPIIIDGVSYKGLMAQRRVSEFVNEDRARELIAEHHEEDRCLYPVTTFEVDYDELYALNQEGIISDEEIDSIIEPQETFALVRVKK